jgi:hypothetical protein
MFVFDSRINEDSDQLAERTRTVTCAGVPGARRCQQTPRFEGKELGGIEMVSMALVLCAGDRDLSASIDHELLEPPDTGTESWLYEPPRQPGASGRCVPASCSADQ